MTRVDDCVCGTVTRCGKHDAGFAGAGDDSIGTFTNREEQEQDEMTRRRGFVRGGGVSCKYKIAKYKKEFIYIIGGEQCKDNCLNSLLRAEGEGGSGGG